VQLLSLLTSVQNSHTQPPVFQQRPEECTGCGETKAADKIARVLLRHRAERSAAMPMYTGTVMSRGPVVGGVNDFLPFLAAAPAAIPVPRTDMMHHFHDEGMTRQFFKEIVGRDRADVAVNGTELSPVFFFFEEKPGVRIKRMTHDEAQQLQEAAFRQYLADNCRIRTKTNEGHVLGDSLLVSGEYIRNPLRAAAEKIYEDENNNQPMPAWLVQFYEGVNMASDVVLGLFTLGVYPVVKYASAKGLKATGHAVNGDMSCLRNEFSPEEMAALLFDTEVGLTHRQIFADVAVRLNPAELTNVKPFRADGLFVHEHMNGHLNTVKYMKVSYQGKEYLIKEGRPGEYYLFDPAASGPDRLDRRVYFDEINNKIHLNREMPAEQGLDYEVIDGKHFIVVQGEQHELTYNWQTNTPELVLNKHNGETVFIPVYMEPLSRRWHLSTHNGHPVFSAAQNKRLNRMAVDRNPAHDYISYQNDSPAYYGTGRLYRAEKKGDTSHYPWGTYVEMNGKLVPVREKVIPGHGVRYVIDDKRYPDGLGYQIEWDGSRWLFERPSSVHASRRLIKSVKPDMFKRHMDASTLSAPDSYGLRWNGQKEAYLKVKRHYVRVRKLNDNRFAIRATPHHHRMILRFKNNQFVVETLRERLDNLARVGLSGRKRQYPVDVLKEQDGFTEDRARALLAEYDFADNGLFSDYAFVLHIEQTGKIPGWAKRFKKNSLDRGSPVDSTETITVLNPNFPGHHVKFRLAGELGEGRFGEVFLDADDTRYVIKRYFSGKLSNTANRANNEADTFKRYYGEESAQVFKGEDSRYYVRMYRVPGQILGALPEGSLPEDAVERFVDMLEKLNHMGIMHGDLHSANILWDAETKIFYPIDINNIKETYFNADLERKGSMNALGESTWDEMIEEIEERMIM